MLVEFKKEANENNSEKMRQKMRLTEEETIIKKAFIFDNSYSNLSDLSVGHPLNLTEQMKEEHKQIEQNKKDREELVTMATGNELSLGKVKAKYDYLNGQDKPKDLSFRAGDVIEIVRVRDKDWWVGIFEGRKGFFPINYMEPSGLLEKLTK